MTPAPQERLLPGPADIRDLSPDVLDADGRMKILPAAYWAQQQPIERFLFGAKHGLHSFPTVELLARLREIIADRTAIEIGAGHGVLADALGIPGTDNREQDNPAYQLIYGMRGQRTAPYGPNIVTMNAATAVRQYRPQVVIGCWVTQSHDGVNWKPGDGKADGVDEEDVLAHCETYVLIGNTAVHEKKRIWRLPHTIERPPYVYSRAFNGSPDFLAVWNNPATGGAS